MFDGVFRHLSNEFLARLGGRGVSGGEEIRELVQERLENLSKLKLNREFKPGLVHFMREGLTACRREGVPKDWPIDELWSGTWEHVNCPKCREKKK